jgi:hypothetical protein
MSPLQTKSRRPSARRRGSAYLLVLSTSMIVAVVGIAAVLALRLQRQVAEADTATVEARFATESVLDLAIFRLRGDVTWRAKYANDTWTDKETVSLQTHTATYRFKLVDEGDGDLADDPTDPVRLYVEAAVGNAARLYSVLLQAEQGDSVNLLTNADMESGTTDWTGRGYCDLESRSDAPHGGAACIWVKGRDGVWAGPNQDVTAVLKSGTTYYAEAWVRMKDAPDDVKITLYTNSTGSGSQWDSITVPNVDTEWTKVSGTITPSWGGTLNSAYWRVETRWTMKEFGVDDAMLVEGLGPPGIAPEMIPVAGTWRQEVLP